MVTGICDLLVVASQTFLETHCRHTEDARSVMPDLQLGTLFLAQKTVQALPTF